MNTVGDIIVAQALSATGMTVLDASRSREMQVTFIFFVAGHQTMKDLEGTSSRIGSLS
ncbi:hypothetical protein [Mycolicibacterium sp. P9-64]|uniref:hypothetical protein n=1 Tax=Mycolicibacterium sp. P9-64 TaxID=2024612 RepID=UPI0015634730|nr:hypothetical protein [Mycolicibacterium sp. P9-64]